MTAALLTVAGFLSGSVMFSLWLGRLALRQDIREVGDGNPGAFNVMAAGGKAWGFAALMLDVFKGAIPVGLGRWFLHIDGAPLVAVAIAPVLGHAFSPWLGFKGGKAVAVTFGVWVGLTAWEAPTFMGILLGLWFSIVAGSGWAVMLMTGCMFAYYLITYPDPVWLSVLALNAALFAYKYRADLRRPLDLRPSFKRLIWRST
ncbi:MAG: glycerol-3-phosphate acyltransferase [Anaerolineae bacterium]|nr:glycerol-3-phosphate acyltransferase [Anaerolineae bacterium]